jgi:hypothetical protein
MELTENDRGILKMLVEHYGDIKSWKIDHWKNHNEMLNVKRSLWLYEYGLGNDRETVYEKEFQRLTTLGSESQKLVDLAIKVIHVEGLEPDEKLFLQNKLIDEVQSLNQKREKLTDKYLSLMQEYRDLLQDKTVNPGTFNRKKPIGRPKSMIIFQWMDYLVSELGTKKKAADYASDSPMTDPKNPDSLLREYRRYLKLKGGT